MGNPLRDRRTPSELAEIGQVIEFTKKISDFEKLAEIVEGDLGTLNPDKLPPNWRDTDVTGQLSFGFADAQKGLVRLQGQVDATIDAVCQRCLESFHLPLAVKLRLLFGSDESTVADDEGYEVWELEGDTLRPQDLVEEILIMALPLAAMHVDSETCRAAEAVEESSGKKTRPFAALKARMEEDK